MWLNEVELKPGQVVTIDFLADGEVLGDGRTIDELYPEADEAMQGNEKSVDECFRELRARPNLRPGYSFLATTPKLSNQRSTTVSAEFSFSCSVLWNWLRHDRASASLSTWTIDSVEFNTPSREHFREYINPGHSVQLQVDA
jgi:hypothetical protein